MWPHCKTKLIYHKQNFKTVLTQHPFTDTNVTKKFLTEWHTYWNQGVLIKNSTKNVKNRSTEVTKKFDRNFKTKCHFLQMYSHKLTELKSKIA